MTVYVRALPTLFRVAFARLIAYRIEMVIWILTALLPLIMLALWDAVVSGGPVAGFGQAEIARYFVATLVVRQLTGAWVLWQKAFEIRTGKLSPQLLRPMHPLFVDAIWMLAAWPLRLIVLIPLVALVIVYRPDLIQVPHPAALALFAISVFLAWLLSFLIQAIVALLSFWTDRSEAFFGLYNGVWVVLSGYIAPIALFPDWAQATIRWLPFRATLATPVELLGGFADPWEALLDVGIQVGWVALALLVTAVVWRQGLKRYGAFGA